MDVIVFFYYGFCVSFVLEYSVSIVFAAIVKEVIEILIDFQAFLLLILNSILRLNPAEYAESLFCMLLLLLIRLQL